MAEAKEKKEKKVLNSNPDFVPKSVLEIGEEFIFNYCNEDKERAAWYLEMVQMKEKTKSGLERPISFPKQRKMFAEKFFPEIYQQAKQQKQTAAETKQQERIRAMKEKFGLK